MIREDDIVEKKKNSLYICPNKCLNLKSIITVTSQITGVSIVYSTVCSGEDQRKHQSSASLAFVRGIHWWPVNSPHKWPVTRKMFPFDDVIMDTNTTYFVKSTHLCETVHVMSLFICINVVSSLTKVNSLCNPRPKVRTRSSKSAA